MNEDEYSNILSNSIVEVSIMYVANRDGNYFLVFWMKIVRKVRLLN